VTLNPNGNDPKIPTKPDGSRDLLGQWEWLKVWEKLEAIVKTGKVRAIGVSNCSVYYLEKLLETAKVVPAVNQVSSLQSTCGWI
jgi:glycerol 2-dehydrogenase (NADP+)